MDPPQPTYPPRHVEGDRGGKHAQCPPFAGRRRSIGAREDFLRHSVVPFIVTRGALLAAIGLANAFVPLNAGACFGCEPTGIGQLDDLARWDGHWYIEIARHGYSYHPGEQSAIAFFPLYPLLIRVASMPFGGDPTASAIVALVISNLALLAASAVLVRLAATELGMSNAERVPTLLLVWPTSVFLSAVYPESLFVLLAALSFLAARRDRWREAGIAAGLTTLTRPFGFAVAAALLIEIARRPPGTRLRPLMWLAPAPVAAIGWWAYLTSLTGDPWAFVITQTRFRRVPSEPFRAVGELFDPAQYGFPYLVAGVFVFTVILIAIGWCRMRPTLPAYATIVLAFVMGSGTLTSSMRHEIALFPVLFVLAGLGRRAGLAYTVVAMVLSLVLGAMFARQFWIG